MVVLKTIVEKKPDGKVAIDNRVELIIEDKFKQDAFAVFNAIAKVYEKQYPVRKYISHDCIIRYSEDGNTCFKLQMHYQESRTES